MSRHRQAVRNQSIGRSQNRKSSSSGGGPSPKLVYRGWVGFFCFWMLLLTGFFQTWLKSPGLKQWVEIQHVLSDKRQEISMIESESTLLKETIRQIETNPVAQEREIRKVLGFVDQNEIVFEFEK